MAEVVQGGAEGLGEVAAFRFAEAHADLDAVAVADQQDFGGAAAGLLDPDVEPAGRQQGFLAAAGVVDADDAEAAGAQQDHFLRLRRPCVPAEQQDGEQQFDASETADRPGADGGEDEAVDHQGGGQPAEQEGAAAGGEAAVGHDDRFEDGAVVVGRGGHGPPVLASAAQGGESRSMPESAPTRKPRKPRAMTLPEVRAFLEALARANPNPESELHYSDPFTLLVAVVLSAQATDASVNKATVHLFKEASTPAAMAALGAERIGQHIRTIGLWQGKAKNVAALSQALIDHHGGQVPHDRAALEALPGVGRKTANVVLNVAFGEPTMAVDTHVFRLGNRTGIAPGANVRTVENGLVKRIPADLLRDAHHLLILHGRYVCKARTPECWRCVASEWCKFADKTLPPVVKPKKA